MFIVSGLMKIFMKLFSDNIKYIIHDSIFYYPGTINLLNAKFSGISQIKKTTELGKKV